MIYLPLIIIILLQIFILNNQFKTMATIQQLKEAEDAEAQSIQAVLAKLNEQATQLANAQPGTDESDALLAEIQANTALLQAALGNGGGGGGIDLANPNTGEGAE